jgi:predicted LPLAT superfamily acyltransferase
MEIPTYREYLEVYAMRQQIEREARRAQAQAVLKYAARFGRFCAWLAAVQIKLQAPSRAVF